MAENFLEEKLDMIGEGLEYMDRVVLKLDDVCSTLRKKEKLENIVQISEGLMAVVQIIEYTNELNKIEINENEIASFISDIVDGMENGDYNLVADILEYEIKPLYQKWADVFAEVLEKNV